LGLLGVLFFATLWSLQFNHGGIGMNNRILSCLIAGTLSATLALASPVLARGGGGGGHGGGMHGGMHGGGMHVGGMGGGMRFGGAQFAGPRFASTHFVGNRFAGARFAHARFHHGRFFHHRRFAFIGVPYAYASYNSCWRRTWTPYGLRWVNVCNYYGYY
jgi:hypothetical protein